MRRYVYHAPVEPPPRALASGNENVVGLGAAAIMRVTGACPAWGCGGPPPPRNIIIAREPIVSLPPVFLPLRNWVGSTSTVEQPPPATPAPVSTVAAPAASTLSPAPSPTVAVNPDQTAPTLAQPGTVLDSSGSSVTTASSVGSWFGESTLISGIPNWGIAAAAAFVGLMFLRGGHRR